MVLQLCKVKKKKERKKKEKPLWFSILQLWQHSAILFHTRGIWFSQVLFVTNVYVKTAIKLQLFLIRQDFLHSWFKFLRPTKLLFSTVVASYKHLRCLLQALKNNTCIMSRRSLSPQTQEKLNFSLKTNLPPTKWLLELPNIDIYRHMYTDTI